ncbi:MAG: OmpH family outer membrane protein [Kiritimatiellae bacterium]|nr:OmpH family outer membrane protein [Kiritimatiellia bacterium]
MKKTVFAVAAAIAVSASAELKFGTVDLMLLVKNHPNYESNKTLLTSTDNDYQKKLDAIKAEGDKLQEEGKKLSEQMRNPMLATKAKSDIENQLVDIQKKLMGIEQRYRSEAVRCRQDLQDLERRLLKTTTDDLRKRIAKFAGANGYDFIFDANAAAYAGKSFDVTDDMLKALGVDPKEARGRDEGK